MAKLNDDIKERILADWKAGVSQNELARRYKVSPATINKLCKGIVQSNLNLVNAKVAVVSALSQKSECEVNSIEAEVNTKVKHLKLINDNATKLADKLSKMADDIDSANDLKTLVEANDRLAITLKVADRHAPKIELNNTNAQQNKTEMQINIIRDN